MREKRVEILYISSLSSERVFNYLFRRPGIKPRQEAQKFHRLLFEGFACHQEICSVSALSGVPVDVDSLKRTFLWFKPEIVNESRFRYAPLISIPVLRELALFLYTLIRVVFWFAANRKHRKVIICDALKLSMSSAALIAGFLLPVNVVGIVTDIPGLMINPVQNPGIKYKMFDFITSIFITRYSGYILLTEEMNRLVNPRNRPFTIMEGLVDNRMKDVLNDPDLKSGKRVVLYAGAIYEKYGVKKLILAFMKLKDRDILLHIYGSGELEGEMERFMAEDERIVYKGVVPNNVVVKEQLRAVLLVNPRPTDEMFTKYSFPSKNMEYMASGTPLITTALPGMPKEYYDHVYIFNDETVDGMAGRLLQILSKPPKELHAFGLEAKNFVLSMKNNYIQSQRLLSFFITKL